MTNEMKLLTALCDALGFDVERVCVNKLDLDRYNNQLRDTMARSSMFSFVVGAEVKPIYEYKLTQRVVDAEIEWGKSVGILDENGDHKQ
jgi:hypothetical protein